MHQVREPAHGECRVPLAFCGVITPRVGAHALQCTRFRCRAFSVGARLWRNTPDDLENEKRGAGRFPLPGLAGPMGD